MENHGTNSGSWVFDGAPGFPGFPFAHEIGITLLWLAAILTVQTGSGYLINAVKHVTEYRPNRPNGQDHNQLIRQLIEQF